MTRVRLSHIPDAGALEEHGLLVPQEVIGLQAPFEGQIGLGYHLRWVADKILGDFEAKSAMRLTCSRCLGEFSQEATSQFLIQFEAKPEVVNPRSGLDPEDPELNVVFFSGDEIDFGDELRQELELLIPFAPLCREDCQGLCPDCGRNRNEAECGCSSRSKNRAFGALDTLFPKKKEK